MPPPNSIRILSRRIFDTQSTSRGMLVDAPVTTSIILSFSKTGQPRFTWKMAVKMETERRWRWQRLTNWKLQSHHTHRNTDTHVFTGQMQFLPPSQQRHSTAGNKNTCTYVQYKRLQYSTVFETCANGKRTYYLVTWPVSRL